MLLGVSNACQVNCFVNILLVLSSHTFNHDSITDKIIKGIMLREELE